MVDFVQGKLPAYLAGGANFIDVRDAARGLILAMEKGKVGDKYLLGAHNVTFRQVLSLLAKITGRRAPKIAIPRWAAKIAGRAAELVSNKPPIDRASALLMGDHWYYDSSKAERELGLTARPLVETLRSAVAWFREHGYAG